LAGKSLLKERVIYISSEWGPCWQNLFFEALTFIGNNKKVIFPVLDSINKMLPYISQLLKSGKFNPVIDRKYSLANISQAYEFVITREKQEG